MSVAVTTQARVLLVDDEPDILASMVDLLGASRAHIEIRTAGSGEAGLAMLKDSDVDLIVTDFRMPGMDGVQFLAAAEMIAPGTPTIMVTAFEPPAPGGRGRPQRVLRKPFGIDAFLEAVDAALGVA